MILKVLQPDTGKWFYYDNIDLFKIKNVEFEIALRFFDTDCCDLKALATFFHYI